MKTYIEHHPWKIIENGFDPKVNRISESLFSLGNGRFGMRGNFEEHYSGDSLQGSYVAGIYYPDPTRVGWWKNGYPDYFAKVLNATNWIGIDVQLNNKALDLYECEVLSFKRETDMRTASLERTCHLKTKEGHEIEIKAIRFCSLDNDELSVQKYSIRSINFDGELSMNPFLDGDVINEDSNYDEKFWEEQERIMTGLGAILRMSTKKLDFQLTCGMQNKVDLNGNEVPSSGYFDKEKYVAEKFITSVSSGDELVLQKIVAVLSSENHSNDTVMDHCKRMIEGQLSFDDLFQAHKAKWEQNWNFSDIVIEGDVAAQQAIRFNIFQLNQTYTGSDPRLNIGPKGFTGEKYGGCTYWDTEAYCINFYLSTAKQEVGRNLLVYRYKHLKKAIENAQKLGFTNGAALYPMVTINGEECHNEWEITFEEIHRNGAMAYAIYKYVNYTGDKVYLAQYGLEVLIAICRFWAQRVNWSEQKKKFVMLGVTGPNEYENNVNNNWYTNYIASWCMQYTLDIIDWCLQTNMRSWEKVEKKTSFKQDEASKWLEIIEKMYLPEDPERGIFLQQDSFLDKELQPAADIAEADYPIHQNWSWDRILRSCFIKQADVLQGLYFFREHFDKKTIQKNFDFYEPLTVHESSLSPCVHGILASYLGMDEKAYEMYIRTARLDLDDYNNDAKDGLHITSMAGTWMSIVEGFGGMRVGEQLLSFSPSIPKQWKSLSFNVMYRGVHLNLKVTREQVFIKNNGSKEVELELYGNKMNCNPNSTLLHDINMIPQ